MPSELTYPGVYIEEISSGVRTIVGVSTSVTAFIGRAAQGPVNKPQVVTSFGDYVRRFGDLNPDYPISYAVNDFFQNGGSRAVIVRLTRQMTDAELETKQKKIAAVAINDALTAAKPADADEAKAAVNAAVDAIKNDADQSDVTKAEADAIKVTVDALAALPEIQAACQAVVDGYADADVAVPATLTIGGLNLKASSDGVWGNRLRASVNIDGIDANVAGRYGLAIGDLFNLTVEEVVNGEVVRAEQLRNLAWGKPAHARSVDRVLEKSSLLVVAADKPFKALADNPFTVQGNDDPVEAQGGMNGGDLVDTDYSGNKLNKKGLYALEDEDFNLLCIPPDSLDVTADSHNTSAEVYGKAMVYCVERRAMLIVDPPFEWATNTDSGTAVAKAKAELTGLGLNGLAARNAMIYFPRVLMSDPMSEGQIKVFPACGILAGVMARTDATRGVWKAAAGIDDGALLGVRGYQVMLNDKENGLLNPLGINVLRIFPIIGNVVWGARTLRGADQLADEYKYVPVRRLALYIEETLYRNTKWIVFEPNDEPLWAQIRLNIGAFMQDLFRQGAFQGSSPRDAYFVKCDKETTTQYDIDRGIVNIVVGFAPLKPAEFVVIKLQQIAQTQL